MTAFSKQKQWNGCPKRLPFPFGIDEGQQKSGSVSPASFTYETNNTTTTSPVQDYEAYSSNNGGDEEAETRFYTYHGAGMFGCLYKVSEEAYSEARDKGMNLAPF